MTSDSAAKTKVQLEPAGEMSADCSGLRCRPVMWSYRVRPPASVRCPADVQALDFGQRAV
jgi:hypothetical protein